jgi:hypothetical protein
MRLRLARALGAAPPNAPLAARRPCHAVSPRAAPPRAAPPGAGPAAAPSGADPAAPPVDYADSSSDIAFINACRVTYGRLAGWQSPRAWDSGLETYAGMVEVSRALMAARPTAAAQRAAVVAGFPRVPPFFRRLFPYSKWGAELNAAITPAFFSWLVGPMAQVEVEVTDPRTGAVTTQRSGVKIERCRYLAESGCVGMCVNLCKVPVQVRAPSKAPFVHILEGRGYRSRNRG